MKKLVFLIIGILLSVTIVKAQNTCPSFEWGKNIGSTAPDNAIDIATDNQGNVFVFSYYDQNMSLDGNYYVGKGLFIAKLDNQGNYIWTKSIQGVGQPSGQPGGITIDNQGNCYVTSFFNGTIDFGGTTLTSYATYNSGWDMFVSKIDSQGNFIWTKNAGSTGNGSGGIIPNSISTDNQGNCFIVGYISLSSSATFGSITIANTNQADVFVTKLDAQGNFIWVKQAGGNGTDYGVDIATDGQGNSYITGRFIGIATFDSFTLAGLGSNPYIFIAKLDANGDYVWVKQAGSSGANYGMGISIDGQNNCYVTGYLNSYNTQFDSFTLPNSSYSGNYRTFITKLDSQGNFIWVKNIQGDQNVGPTTGHNAGTDIATDTQGNSYVIGWFTGLYMVFESDTALMNTGNYGYNLFLTKIDSQGNVIWQKAGNFEGGDVILNGIAGDRNIAIDNQGGCYLSAPLYGYTYLDGTIMVGSSGNYDVIIAKIQETIPSISPINDLSINCGNDITLSVNAQNYVSSLWTPAIGLSNPNILNPIASPSQNTTYTLTITDDCGNTASEAVTINVTPYTINASATNNTIDCDASTQLNAGISDNIPNISYSWSPTQGLDNPNIANPTATPGLTTTYIVTATTPNGCSATDSVTINVNNPNPPTVNIQSNTGNFGLCDNGLTLSAPGFVSYEWSDANGVVGTSPTLNVSQPGTYTLVAYEASGCAGTASVTITPLAEITAPNGTVLCPGQPSQTLQLKATEGMDSYQWSTGAQTSAINVTQAGSYSVTVTQGSCSYTVHIQVTVSNGQASADFSHAATGLTVQFNVISPSINFLSWDFGDNSPTSFDENPVHTYAQAGTYDVLVTVTDVCGNTAERTKSITVSEGVSLSENEKTTLKIYPNPANSHIFIESETLINEIVLRDLNGREIARQTVNNKKTELNLNKVSKGIYLIEITSELGKYIKRIIKN